MEDVRAAVEALSFVFAECAKANTNELDFIDTMLVLAFPPELNEALKTVRGHSTFHFRGSPQIAHPLLTP